MIILKTVSDTRFSLNNIEYIKNYISNICGQNIRIYNCYDRDDVLMQPIHYTQILLNGQLYSSVTGLHAALQSVLYTRNTLTGGISDTNQDNKGKTIYIGSLTGTNLEEEVLTKINSLDIIIEPTDSPVIFWGDKWIDGRASERVNYLWMGGKGIIGPQGKNVLYSQLYPLPASNLANNDINKLDNAIINSLGEIPDGNYLSAVNASQRDLSLNDKTYYFSYTYNGNLQFILFRGLPGVYNGNLHTDDFIATAVVPAVSPPGLDEVLTTSFQAKNKKIGLAFSQSGEEYYSELSPAGLSFEKTGSKTNLIFENPIAGAIENRSVIIRSTADNEEIAFKSDTKKQILKAIDGLVSDGVYTISENDFGKLLTYNGTESINILLSTNINAEPGNYFHFLQKGAGSLKLVTNGFILHHAADELPQTYGFYALAGVTILEEFSAMVFGKLKLAD